jgi:DNA-binding transcriptional LysR family regulator
MWPGTNSSLLFAEESVMPVCTPSLLKTLETLGSHNKSEKKRTSQVQQEQPLLAHFTHIHITSRPDAWRHWYASQNQAYPAVAAGGPRYELFSMVLAAVHAGLGVGLLPRFLVSEAIKQGDLVMPVRHPLPVSQGYYFGSSLNAEVTPALSAFQMWLLHAGKVFLEQTCR